MSRARRRSAFRHRAETFQVGLQRREAIGAAFAQQDERAVEQVLRARLFVLLCEGRADRLATLQANLERFRAMPEG